MIANEKSVKQYEVISITVQNRTLKKIAIYVTTLDRYERIVMNYSKKRFILNTIEHSYWVL